MRDAREGDHVGATALLVHERGVAFNHPDVVCDLARRDALGASVGGGGVLATHEDAHAPVAADAGDRLVCDGKGVVELSELHGNLLGGGSGLPLGGDGLVSTISWRVGASLRMREGPTQARRTCVGE